MVEDLKMPIEIATNLRKNGINTEIYLNNKKLRQNLNMQINWKFQML